MTSEPDRLFDPADYGATERPKRRRREPGVPTVALVPPWVLLRRTAASPLAHIGRLDRPAAPNPLDVVVEPGVVVAVCGAMGSAIDGYEGREVPACPACAKVRDS